MVFCATFLNPCCLIISILGFGDWASLMRSLESLNEAVGVLHAWDSSMSLEDLDEAELDSRILAACKNCQEISPHFCLSPRLPRLRSTGCRIYRAWCSVLLQALFPQWFQDCTIWLRFDGTQNHELTAWLTSYCLPHARSPNHCQQQWCFCAGLCC